MRLSKLFLTVVIVVWISSCSKSSSGPTSAEGNWTYTTPDNKISVSFALVKNSSGSLDIQNSALKIEGVAYNSAAQISGVALPVIGSIRINANDAKAIYPYDIQFTNGSVSSDFKKINVPDAEYTYSGGSNTLKAIVVGRP